MTLHYHAGWNMPGYMPECDVYYFDTPESAKQFMIDELDRAGDGFFDIGETEDERGIADEYSAAMEDLNLANVSQGWGVTLPTSLSTHDLGEAYWITVCNEDCEDEES